MLSIIMGLIPITLAIMITISMAFIKVIDRHSKKLIIGGLWFWAVLDLVRQIVPNILDNMLPGMEAGAAVRYLVSDLYPLWMILVGLGIISMAIHLLIQFVFTPRVAAPQEEVECRGFFKGRVEIICNWVVRLGGLATTAVVIITRVQWIIYRIENIDFMNFSGLDIYYAISPIPQGLIIILSVFAALSVCAMVVTAFLAQRCAVTNYRVLGNINLFTKVDIPLTWIYSVTEGSANEVIITTKQGSIVSFTGMKNHKKILKALAPYAPVIYANTNVQPQMYVTQ